jgi:hypothetical protein
MKGLFRRLGSPGAGKGSSPQPPPAAEDVSEQLARAAALLRQMRAETGTNFPLLNNATRLGRRPGRSKVRPSLRG